MGQSLKLLGAAAFQHRCTPPPQARSAAGGTHGRSSPDKQVPPQMLTRRVLLTVKDPDGDIVGQAGDWGGTSKNTAVRETLTGSCRYYLALDANGWTYVRSRFRAAARFLRLRINPRPITCNSCRTADRLHVQVDRCGEDRSMSVDKIENAVHQVLQAMQRRGSQVEDDELALRYAMIDPILRGLGWDTAQPWECQPNGRVGRSEPLDYVLYDHAGSPAVLIEVETRTSRRREHRTRLRRQTRGMAGCLAVLTYGCEWEIYDIDIRGREFTHKRVDRLVLDPQGEGSPTIFARGLYHWLSRDLWW